MPRIICRVLGVVFVIRGAAVFLRGGHVDPYHNLLHFLTGIAALYFGFVAPREQARIFCVGFGAGCHLMTGDHLFHVVLGSALTLCGALRRGAPSAA